MSRQPADYLYSAAECRAIEQRAFAAGITARELMQRAAQAALDCLLRHWPQPESLHIFAGGGNNAGDGFDLARLAAARGLRCEVYLVGKPEQLPQPAHQSYLDASAAEVSFSHWHDDIEPPQSGIVIDALLGTGSTGAPRGDYAAAIETINLSGLPVLAIDLPSGIHPDTGNVASEAVYADVTLCLIGLKRGLFTGDAPAYTRLIELHDLDCDTYRGIGDCEHLQLEPLRESLLPPRSRTAHKGHFGHVLVIGGDNGTGGACIMAADSAGRVGAGLVSAATRPLHVAGLLARKPEVMAHAVNSGQELAPLLDTPTVLVIGPGLGQQAWGEQLLQQVTLTDKPVVLDADALNILAAGRVVRQPRRDNWVLTPHPGEAARLLNISITEVQADRFAAVHALQQRYGGVIILKGAGTLICDTDGALSLCNGGNPGMASGGMGDVLTGIIGGLLAQGLPIADAARLAVCLHAAAADRAANRGERGLQATDLIGELQNLVNTEESKNDIELA